MKVTIDRFEGKFAVCEKENREMIDIERDKIPEVAKEGDILILDGDVITVDREQTKQRKEEIQNLFNRLKE